MQSGDSAMSKPSKILLRVTTVWPLVYMLLFIVVMLAIIWSTGSEKGEASSGAILWIRILPCIHLLTMLWVLLLLIFYIVNVFRNERVPADKKTLWAVVLFLGNIIAMPVYWYHYVWRDNGRAP